MGFRGHDGSLYKMRRSAGLVNSVPKKGGGEILSTVPDLHPKGGGEMQCVI